MAVREAKPHFEALRKNFLKMPMEMLLPPGYLTLCSMARVMSAKGAIEGELSIESAMEQGMMICGSAATVRDRLREYHRSVRFGNLLTLLQFGTMPADMSERNQRAFATQVMEPLRKELAAAR